MSETITMHSGAPKTTRFQVRATGNPTASWFVGDSEYAFEFIEGEWIPVSEEAKEFMAEYA